MNEYKMNFSSVIGNYANQAMYLIQRIEEKIQNSFCLTYPVLNEEVFKTLNYKRVDEIKIMIEKLEQMRENL